MAEAVQSGKEQRRPSWLRRHALTLAAVGIFLAGAGIFLYPTFSNWWNSLHQTRAVMDYAQAVSNLDKDQYQQVLDDARAYNERLAQTGDLWRMSDAQQQEYESLLDVTGTGIMGYIQIPKINLQLPVYHGTDEGVLQTSIGHIAGSSLPVGGDSTHCLLSGHRGLPSSRLFTDLDKLSEGDTFTLTVLDETLTYEVDQVKVVEPDDISDVQIEPGQDLCTLITCTPYGVNTHRLLVRGHRIPNSNGDARVIAEAIQIRPVYIAPFIAAPVVVVLAVLALARSHRRGHKPDLEGQYLAERGLERPRRIPFLPGEDGHGGKRDDVRHGH